VGNGIEDEGGDDCGGGGGGDGSCSGITASFERKRNGERCLNVFNILWFLNQYLHQENVQLPEV
jgi:hypothetical protein